MFQQQFLLESEWKQSDYQTEIRRSTAQTESKQSSWGLACRGSRKAPFGRLPFREPLTKSRIIPAWAETEAVGGNGCAQTELHQPQEFASNRRGELLFTSITCFYMCTDLFYLVRRRSENYKISCEVFSPGNSLIPAFKFPAAAKYYSLKVIISHCTISVTVMFKQISGVRGCGDLQQERHRQASGGVTKLWSGDGRFASLPFNVLHPPFCVITKGRRAIWQTVEDISKVRQRKGYKNVSVKAIWFHLPAGALSKHYSHGVNTLCSCFRCDAVLREKYKTHV